MPVTLTGSAGHLLGQMAALAASLYGWWRWEKEIEALHGQLTDFLEGRKNRPFSA